MHKIQVLALTGCLAASMILGGCGLSKADFTKPQDKNQISYTFPKQDTYKNFLNVEGQWGKNKYTGDGEYGIGDPFIMRYDGKYYMYPSSADGEDGVKVYESKDMIHWTYKGFASSDQAVAGAYAPEVVYYNGSFYMCESKGGTGHYILKSASPIGPFKPVTDNFGKGIDGSFFVTSDGKLMFLYAENSQIKIASVNTDTMVPGKDTVLNASLNGWTEGPGLFRRGNTLYLTYAGNSVVKDGYRVGYSYQLGGADPKGSFIMPTDNLLILKTASNGFRGLGHSSNVIGPNLDSWYTAYHNLISTAGPQRRLMIDQICSNGGLVSMNGPTYTSVTVPERPDFEGRPSESNKGFDTVTLDGISSLISQSGAKGVFTAEYNFTPNDSSTVVNCLFGYKDAQNYSSIRLDMSAGKLSFVKISGGKETILKTADIGTQATGCLHTVRVENGYKETNVYVDSMQKLTATGAGIEAGKIGYSIKGKAVCSYTAFSNDAMGTSDFDTIKNLPSSFSAVQYLKGENRGFSIAKAKVTDSGVRQGEKGNTVLNKDDGSYSLVMDTPKDWVKYAVNASETSYYGLIAQITPKSAGSQFQVIVDDKDIYTFTVSSAGNVDSESGYVHLLLGQFKLTAGDHTLKIRLVSGSMTVKSFELTETNPTTLTYKNAMNEINEQGWNYSGNWKIINGAHTVKPGDTAYAFAGTEKLTDFSIELNVAINVDDSINEGGLLLRCSNESINTGSPDSFQGYYLSIRNDQVSLYKDNYGNESIDLVKVSFKKDVYHKIKAELINNCIKIYVDDMKNPAITYYDSSAFLSGEIGLCSNKIGMSFKDVEIKTNPVS